MSELLQIIIFIRLVLLQRGRKSRLDSINKSKLQGCQGFYKKDEKTPAAQTMALPENYIDTMLWWPIPGELAGMPMPFLAPERRFCRNALPEAFDDDLPLLLQAGIRSLACLLNIPSDKGIYEQAGIRFLCSFIPDYRAPSFEQMEEIHHFIHNSPAPLVVHCEGGLGRTGCVLAAELICRGMSASEAIRRVRCAEPAAIETAVQENFLFELAQSLTPD